VSHRLLVLGLLPLSIPASAAPQPAESTQAADDLIARLAAGVVTDVPPSVLYTWTTDEQLTRLAGHHMLLTRTESPDHGQTGFALRIVEHAGQTGSPAASLLTRPGFARHRYAWSNPWATAMGWEEETYGDRLIQVTLRDEAWMAIFDTAATKPLRFVDMQGRAVAEADVLAHPERIGLVLHIKPRTFVPDERYHTFGVTSPEYREYVLVNEAMIRRWSHGGAEQRQVLSESRALLEALRPRLPDTLPPLDLDRLWRQPPGPDPVDLYLHNLALSSAQYWPEPHAIDALIAHLDTIGDAGRLTVEPGFTFSLDHPPPIPGGVP
jgi:hypothetical protein